MTELFQNVLTASFHGSIVIAVVMVLRLVLKKTPKKYICLLWMLAGIRLLMPFEIQSSLSLQPEVNPVAQIQQAETEEKAASQSGEIFFEDQMSSPVTITPQEPAQTAVQSQSQNQTVKKAEPVQTPDPVQAEEETAFNWSAVIPWIWLAVACCFGLYSLVCYLKLRNQVREAIKIPGGWESDRIETAFILGFIKPRIYIPMGMPKRTRRHILAHERTHLEKGDHWIKMIGYIALAIHWFNPLVWAAYILLCKDIEMACDERVVQFMELEERKEYSAALLTCSTNRAHFAACPVAFGEVSVKTRIKSVLNYKKPGFWISLVGVIAIIFVAVCLVTSPTEAPENSGEAANAAIAEEPSEPVEVNLFSADMTNDEIVAKCTDAINALKAQETFCVKSDQITESTNQHYASGTYVSYFRKFGENFLTEVYDDAGDSWGSTLIYEGQYGMHMGDAWCWQGEATNNNSFLDKYSPEGKSITFPEGTGVTSGNTLSFYVMWTEANPFDRSYSGTYTYTFNADGSIASVTRDYVYQVSEADGGGEVHYVVTMTVQEEAAEDTKTAIQTIADQTMTSAELEEARVLKEQVTEVPSNKTTYDKEFSLGSSQMGWKFMKGEWFFKFGAEDVTSTGAKLVVEINTTYGNGTVTGGTMVAGSKYFIERLDGDTWVTVEPTAENFTSINPVTMSAGSSVTINWENNYGELPYGFYRIGNYYTFTSNTGETDTQVCYAKFRLYDPKQDELLNKCRTAFDALLASDSYHIYTFDWMTAFNDYDYYISDEVWKSGEDYLEVASYPLRSDMSQMSSVRGSMWRDGKYYGLEWSGTPVSTSVSSWWRGVDGYLDDSNFDTWTFDFDWYDSRVALVYEDGNTIHILENYSDVYEYSDLAMTFDEDGNLAGIVKYYLPTLNCGESERIVEDEMVVFDDTSTSVISETIKAQNVSDPMTFSYDEDVKNNPNAQTSGFKNTTATTISTAAEAIARADKESTMPQILDFDNGYLQTRAYRDEKADMWKVELFWWQHDTMQTIYMNDQGITQMIVSVE